MTLTQIAKKNNMFRQTLKYRSKYIFGHLKNNYDFNDQEIKLLLKDKNQRSYKPKTLKYPKEAIDVIEYFLKNKNNSIDIIVKELKFSRFFVLKTIDNYLKTKEIIVESKMNKL